MERNNTVDSSLERILNTQEQEKTQKWKTTRKHVDVRQSVGRKNWKYKK